MLSIPQSFSPCIGLVWTVSRGQILTDDRSQMPFNRGPLALFEVFNHALRSPYLYMDVHVIVAVHLPSLQRREQLHYPVLGAQSENPVCSPRAHQEKPDGSRQWKLDLETLFQCLEDHGLSQD